MAQSVLVSEESTRFGGERSDAREASRLGFCDDGERCQLTS